MHVTKSKLHGRVIKKRRIDGKRDSHVLVSYSTLIIPFKPKNFSTLDSYKIDKAIQMYKNYIACAKKIK